MTSRERYSHQRSLGHGQGGCRGSIPTAAPRHCTQTHQRTEHCAAHETTSPYPEGENSLLVTAYTFHFTVKTIFVNYLTGKQKGLTASPYPEGDNSLLVI